MSVLTFSSGGIRSASALFTALLLSLVVVPIVDVPGAAAKSPGKTYCFNRVCHRVLTLAETRQAVGKRRTLIASYYSHCRVDKYNPCGLTSSGAKFRPGHADNAASPNFPNGTKLLVWNPANKRAAVIRIDNAGPYWRNRTLDLSRAAAQKLGFRHRGVARLVVQVLQAPTRRQATYRRHRNYTPVPGYLGRFASFTYALRSTTSQSAPSANLAKPVLPVKNIYLAERRIWLARMVETGSVSVALVKRPVLRLPLRPERSRMRKSNRIRHRKVAALTTKPSRSRRLKKRRLTRAKQQPGKAIRSTAGKNRTKNARKKIKRVKPNANQTIKTPATAAKVRSNAAAQSTKSLAANASATQSVIKPRAKMVWRRGILGTNTGGA